MYKIFLGLTVVVLAAVVAAKLLFEASFYAGQEPIHHPWVQNKMEFVAWNDEFWTAWIRNEEFEQQPRNHNQWSNHANISLAFIDWEGQSWQAKIEGKRFLLAYRGDWNGPIVQAEAIRYRDWEGKNTLRTVAQLSR